ncbi:MAG: butyrate kinase [Prevotellaceae bacterium]|jgi:butyrate kinase|nr:butyrate kinase [Prevotellaceae bacterium]
MEKYRILTINPGSTSTKIAVFENDTPIFIKSLKHSIEKLKLFSRIVDQYQFRKEVILEELKAGDIDVQTLDIIVGRGGLIKPIPSGVYEVNEAMVKDLIEGVMGQHASNLGGLIAADIAKSLPYVKAYIADPVVVDELQDVSRIAGHPKFKRVSIFHALNQKAIARRHAKSTNRKYEEMSLIIAHLGGGISVGAHLYGKVIDVNNALDGDGPFSPERSGSLPSGQMIEICFSGKYSKDQMKKMVCGEGGFIAYLGTNQAYDVEIKVREGNAEYKLIQDAMAYQVAKSIGEMATVLKGRVDAILLTGGIANNKYFCDYIRNMVEFIAPIVIYPGEDELSALAMNGLMILHGEIDVKIYQ